MKRDTMEKGSVKGSEKRRRSAGLRKSDIFAVLDEIGTALTSSLELNEVLNAVMDEVSSILHPQYWSVLLVDEAAGELYFEVVVGEGIGAVKDVRLKIGEGVAGWVAKELKAAVIPDVDKDERFSSRADEHSKFKTKSIICVPMKIRGKCLGVIEIVNNIGDDEFFDEDLLLLTAVADFAAIAIQNAKYFHKLKELTITDGLTGLYNLRHIDNFLEYEIARAGRYGSSLAIAFFDIDKFKQINDKYGHDAGNKLLQEMASLLKENVRTCDVVFRYGGDEFVIAMPQISKERAIKAISRIREEIISSRFLEREGINIKITASFGLAVYPDDADGKETLIRLADELMYKIKSTTRNGVAVV